MCLEINVQCDLCVNVHVSPSYRLMIALCLFHSANISYKGRDQMPPPNAQHQKKSFLQKGQGLARYGGVNQPSPVVKKSSEKKASSKTSTTTTNNESTETQLSPSVHGNEDEHHSLSGGGSTSVQSSRSRRRWDDDVHSSMTNSDTLPVPDFEREYVQNSVRKHSVSIVNAYICMYVHVRMQVVNTCRHMQSDNVCSIMSWL